MFVDILREFMYLKRQQWCSERELETIQLSKLKRQVQRAWNYSTFYRERFESVGFEPGDLKSLSDLHKLPITTKAELVSAGESAWCRDISSGGYIFLSTSGSSGYPITLPFTRYDKAHRVLKELRALVANGYNLTNKMAVVIAPSDIVQKQMLFQRLGLLRRHYMSIYQNENDLAEKLRSLHPDVIYSYTSTLRFLADKVLAGECSVIKPKILVSAAEVMEPSTRQILALAFGVDPVDFYGSMEFGWMAWQCAERSGYHINADCIIMESIFQGRPAESGEEGELVVTNLHSDAVPLIRYATGDTGILSNSKCACGRTLPMMTGIGGRLADCITLPSGRKLTPYKVTCALENISGIRQFQIVQESQSRIRIRLLRNGTALRAETVQTAIKRVLEEPADVIVEYTDTLDKERNGKFKVVKSLVTSGVIEHVCTAVSSQHEQV